jgi:hypothetical protein
MTGAKNKGIITAISICCGFSERLAQVINNGNRYSHVKTSKKYKLSFICNVSKE